MDPTTAKAVGAWLTADFSRRLGFTKIIVGGDSLEVAQALRKEDQCWNRYEMLINDTKVVLLSFPSWETSHVKRGANTAAHILAQYALQLGRRKSGKG
jgi:hypothetical protein